MAPSLARIRQLPPCSMKEVHHGFTRISYFFIIFYYSAVTSSVVVILPNKKESKALSWDYKVSYQEVAAGVTDKYDLDWRFTTKRTKCVEFELGAGMKNCIFHYCCCIVYGRERLQLFRFAYAPSYYCHNKGEEKKNYYF